jgi:hypothetical protein
MDKLPRLEIVDWQDSPLPTDPKTRARRRSLPPTLIGILGTVLLHAMLIQSASFASRGLKTKPPEAQELANARSRSTADPGRLVLISLSEIANANQAARKDAISSLPDLSKMKINSPVSADPTEFLDLETLALSEDQSFHPIASGADGAEQTRLFGIYKGQIQARIDRVWRRPRTPINESTAGKKPTGADESFQCEAQIVQDVRGNVQEILLPRCNGSAAWQHSLVLAIQQASPLPAPPNAKVFTQAITLRFVGSPYESRSPEGEYEFETRKIAISD